jgi:hypothetical protein
MVLLLDADEEEIDRAVVKKRSIWVHDILKKRKVEGEHATLNRALIGTSIVVRLY